MDWNPVPHNLSELFLPSHSDCLGITSSTTSALSTFEDQSKEGPREQRVLSFEMESGKGHGPETSPAWLHGGRGAAPLLFGLRCGHCCCH